MKAFMNTFTILWRNEKGKLISKDFSFECHTVQKAKELFEESNDTSALSISKH